MLLYRMPTCRTSIYNGNGINPISVTAIPRWTKKKKRKSLRSIESQPTGRSRITELRLPFNLVSCHERRAHYLNVYRRRQLQSKIVWKIKIVLLHPSRTIAPHIFFVFLFYFIKFFFPETVFLAVLTFNTGCTKVFRYKRKSFDLKLFYNYSSHSSELDIRLAGYFTSN